MKNLLSIAAVLFMAATAFAQVDRSKAPEPGPEPEFNMGTYHEFTMDNGMKVIVVENNKIPRITYQLRLDLPPIKEDEKIGYVSMAGDLLMAGTKNRTKAQIDETVDFLGASMFTGASFVYCSGLSRHKDELFDLLTDVTLNPTFPQEELDKLKTQAMSSLQANKEDPSSISSNVKRSVVYGKNHPYGEIRTEASVSAITAEDCKNYYEQFFTPQVAYLVIVGDISVAEAKKMANAKLGKWEGHKVVKGRLSAPESPNSPKVAFAHRSGAVQSVVSITYPIERVPGDDDYIASSIMNSILGGSSFGARLMQNLREDKAYTYGCRSSLGSDRYVASFSANASVRNEVTDSAITEILFEMQKMIDEVATEDELRRVKASMKGSFSRSLENAQTIAGYALNTSLYGLPKDYYNGYLQRVEAVTLNDVKKAAKKYLRPNNCYIVVVGDGVNVAPKLEKFGELTYYNSFGEKTDAPGFTLPEGLTAEKVLLDAVKAYGGLDDILKMKTYALDMEAETPQGSFKIMKKVSLKKDWYLQSMIVGGNLVGESKLYNDEYTQTQMGQTTEADETTKKAINENMPLYDEMKLFENLNKVELKGGEVLNGNKVIVLEYKNNGDVQKRYYDLETKYLVATSAMQQGQEVTWTYSDYKDYGGFMFPSKAKNSAMPFEFEITTLEVNTKLKKKTFK